MSPLSFATGGVLAMGRRTFRTPDGRFGQFGEAGPELGFFPLKRGSDGNLGVQAVGGNKPSTVNQTTNVSVSVRATDPNAFRRSQPQIISDAKRLARMRR